MTSVRATATVRAGGRQESRSQLLLSVILPFATGLSILGGALLLLLTPLWTHWAIDVSAAGNVPQMPHELSDMTVRELLFGPATFTVAGTPAYAPDEIAHLRDVRIVLWSFLALAGLSAALIVVAARRYAVDTLMWRAVARGGIGLAATLVVLGVLAFAAFGLAFELFHMVLFPGGNWSFDPSSNLIRLYPLGFWQLSAAAMGVLGVTGGLLVWRLARKRAEALEQSASLRHAVATERAA